MPHTFILTGVLPSPLMYLIGRLSAIMNLYMSDICQTVPDS